MTALRGSDAFVRIVSHDHVFYGGDQAWLASTLGQYGGCGTVAAANVTAYLALHHLELVSLYGEKNRKQVLPQKAFLRHMA